ncbi:hypothetical protein QFC20_007570 [Naganishia adeliensis]|uniref:Uncharacterized protein n=1 Tax=Naganishia adeliensis TaxID=92952 RepID=A0ACC2UYL5_9TREE|nr:hypothetical protein QFC20_007570 [Naganishia adeliensis]
MSTYTKAQPSSIPRATRAAPLAAIGPRPTKASLLRASQVTQDLTGGHPAEKRKAAVIQQRSDLNKTGIPVRGRMERKGTAVSGGKKVEGAVGGFAEKKVGAGVGGNKGKTMKGVAAPMVDEVVSFYEAWVKKADSALQPEKKVGSADKIEEVKEFKTTAGEKAPWRLKKGEKQQFYEGEPDWEYLKALQQYNGENEPRFNENAKVWLEQMEDPNETGYLRMMEDRFKGYRFDAEVEDLQAKIAWEVTEATMILYIDNVIAEEKVEEEKGDHSNWSIYIFGGNPLLSDEPMPFQLEGDQVFDDIMAESIAQQEDLEEIRRIETEDQQRINEQMAVSAALAFEIELTRYKAEVEESDEQLTSDVSTCNIFLYGPNPSLLDEPMPFSLPAPHPDTTFELGDLSVLPAHDMSLLMDETEPHLRDVLANIPEWWVPEPEPQDFANMAMDLMALANQGITASDTDMDICGRLQRGLTGFLSSKEEEFFAAPVPMRFEREFEVSYKNEAMITDEEYPGDVSILEALGADDTLLPIDTDPIIQRRLREPNLLAELALVTGPGFLCAALRD